MLIINNQVLNYFGSEPNITIPEGVTSIGYEAFKDCQTLENITIPESVTSIGGGAFSSCKKIIDKFTDKNGMFIINNQLLGYFGAEPYLTIPDGITSIGCEAFNDCNSIKTITMPGSVTTIGDRAFYSCKNLASITIPDGVTSIGNYAFGDCKRLIKITIPNSMTTIGEWAFMYCKRLTDITIPNSVTTISNSAFYFCESLTNITIPDSVTSIGKCAFYSCKNLASITIPDSVTSIGDSAFGYCTNLTSITIPDSVTSIGNSAFGYCINLTSLTIPNGVTTISDDMFEYCVNLTSITVPDSVTSIKRHAFYECNSLTSITIPDSVTDIGNEVFFHCDELIQLRFLESNYEIGENLFGDCMPEGLANCMGELYTHFTDKTLKKYVLVESVWSKMDASAQTEIFLAHHIKALLPLYAKIVRDPDSLGKGILAKLMNQPSANECDCAAIFLCTFGDTGASLEVSRQLYDALKPLKTAKKALKTIEKNALIYSKLNSETQTAVLTGISQKASEILQAEKKSTFSVITALKDFYSLESSKLPKVNFTDGTQAPDWVLAYLFSAHEKKPEKSDDPRNRNLGIVSVYEKPGICENARKMLELLDPKSFQSVMLTVADENLGIVGISKKRFLAFPICRYADDDTMSVLLKRAPKWRSSVSGINAPPFAAFRRACIYSECRSVIIFADKYGGLDEYAAIRGTDAQTIRDTVLADFGFDAEGKKQYDLGNTTIVVTLRKDCTLGLFDTKADKIVKSIPKRGNDEALVATASKDFSDLKKNVKKVIKNRFDQLFYDFRMGTKQKAENWEKAYIGNPVLRTVANIIVWQQEEKTFILKDDQPICADGTPYTIGTAPILVAHPMEMRQVDLSAWQAYFLKNALKQPFEQIWEPVIRPEEVSKDRYAGVSIPYFRFLKQEKHGIFVDDYDFHNEICIGFEDCSATVERLDWNRHEISPNDGFEIKHFSFKKYTRQVNHIVSYLDKATIYNRIANDDISVAQYLGNFTLAQITEFINIAIKNNCPNVTALLLDFKNKNFADFDPMEEFSLEW